MDDPRSAPDAPSEVPLLQRLYDRPFLLLVLGVAIMLIVFTGWGIWEIVSLPQATLP